MSGFQNWARHTAPEYSTDTAYPNNLTITLRTPDGKIAEEIFLRLTQPYINFDRPQDDLHPSQHLRPELEHQQRILYDSAGMQRDVTSFTVTHGGTGETGTHIELDKDHPGGWMVFPNHSLRYDWENRQFDSTGREVKSVTWNDHNGQAHETLHRYDSDGGVWSRSTDLYHSLDSRLEFRPGSDISSFPGRLVATSWTEEYRAAGGYHIVATTERNVRTVHIDSADGRTSQTVWVDVRTDRVIHGDINTMRSDHSVVHDVFRGDDRSGERTVTSPKDGVIYHAAFDAAGHVIPLIPGSIPATPLSPREEHDRERIYHLEQSEHSRGYDGHLHQQVEPYDNPDTQHAGDEQFADVEGGHLQLSGVAHQQSITGTSHNENDVLGYVTAAKLTMDGDSIAAQYQNSSPSSGPSAARPVQSYYTLRDLEPRDPMTDPRLHPPMVEPNQISGTPGNLTYIDPDTGKPHRCEIVTEMQRFGDGTTVTKWYDHDRPNENSEVRDAQGHVTDAHRVDQWVNKEGDTLTRTTDIHNGVTRTTENERYSNGDVRHMETNTLNADGGGYRDTAIRHRDGSVDHTVEHFKPDEHTRTIYHEHTDPSGNVQRSHYIDYGGTDTSAGTSEGNTSSQDNEAAMLVSALNDGRVDHQQLSTVVSDLVSTDNNNAVVHPSHIADYGNLAHLDGSTRPGNLHPDAAGIGHQSGFIDSHHPGGGMHPSDGTGHANQVPVHHQPGDQAAVVPVHDGQDHRHPHADADPAHAATPIYHSHDAGNASIVVPAPQADSPLSHKMVVDHSFQMPDTDGKALPDSIQFVGASGHSSAHPDWTHQLQPDDQGASVSSSLNKGMPDPVADQISWFDQGPSVHPTADGQDLHQQHQTSNDAGNSSFNTYDQFVTNVQSSAHPSDSSDKSHSSNKPHPDDGSNSNLTFAHHQDDHHHDGGGHDDGSYA